MWCIVRRNNVYYFRVRVPQDVRKYFPSAEIFRSLHTGRYKQAKSLARGKLGALERVFTTIRAGVMTSDEIAKLVEKYKREQLSAPIAAHIYIDKGIDVRDFVNQHSVDLKSNIDFVADSLRYQKGLTYDNIMTSHYIAKRNNIDVGIVINEDNFDQVDTFPDDFRTLCYNVALAQKEIYEIQKQRNDEGDSEYDRQEKAKPKSKTLKELIELYQKVKLPGWKDPGSTVSIHKKILHLIDGNTRLSDIDIDMCAQFRNDLKKYPFGNRDYVTPWGELAKKNERRMSERTQSSVMTELSALLIFCRDRDLGVRGNPTKDLGTVPTKCEKVKIREAYTVAELNRMIQELAKEDRVKNSFKFWIPLLLLYTGARDNEICMLRRDDISDGFIHLRNSKTHRQQTKNGKDRKVPVHPQLVQLGFYDYLKKQRKAKQDRLFSNLKINPKGKWNDAYGLYYRRVFKKTFLVGYSKAEMQAKDLHTFRYTFVEWFSQAGLTKTMEDMATLRAIVGHYDSPEIQHIARFLDGNKVTDGYGGSPQLDLKAYLERLNYGIDLSPLMIT